jgi:hypothetical protein
MSQVFHHSANTLARASVVALVLGAGFALALVVGSARSPYVTRQGVARDQPVPFSHQHHVGGMGVDCRYCHTAVETSSFAGIPPTATCMNCHSQIWSDSPTLEPVRASYRDDRSLLWTRVHDLPGFVYFDHSAHLANGIGCTTCHGRVDQMPLVFQEASLLMEWCLECHRQPERFVRPKSEVFDPAWEPPADQIEVGRRLVALYDIRPRTSCSTCHR